MNCVSACHKHIPDGIDLQEVFVSHGARQFIANKYTTTGSKNKLSVIFDTVVPALFLVVLKYLHEEDTWESACISHIALYYSCFAGLVTLELPTDRQRVWSTRHLQHDPPFGHAGISVSLAAYTYVTSGKRKRTACTEPSLSY